MDKGQLNKLWQTVLSEIELTVTSGNFITFFKPTELSMGDGKNFKVLVNNIFAKTQFEKKFDHQVKEILKNHDVITPQIEYVIKGKKSANNNDDDTVKLENSKSPTKGTSKSYQKESGLNPKYRFDNFVVGGCNDLAHAASQAAAAMPGKKYNPIFIYGNSGLGKTHLIQAVGNEILEKSPDKRVLYVTAETFGNEFIDYIRFKKDRNFSNKYRGVDVLIIDDIQFIAGKKSTQEEFFNTFNTLHQSDKQIVVSADRPPTEIPDLADRLKTRFQMGMTIDVSMPDYETRCAIISSKSVASGINLPSDIVEFLADRIRTNIRELEGSLNQILAYCEMRNETPTIELAMGFLSNNKNSRPKHITAKQVVDKTANYFDLKSDELRSPSRNKHIAEPRQIAMYLLRSELKLSFPLIARELGRSDHTTAMHSIDKIEMCIKMDARIREHVSIIRERLYV